MGGGKKIWVRFCCSNGRRWRALPCSPSGPEQVSWEWIGSLYAERPVNRAEAGTPEEPCLPPVPPPRGTRPSLPSEAVQVVPHPRRDYNQGGSAPLLNSQEESGPPPTATAEGQIAMPAGCPSGVPTSADSNHQGRMAITPPQPIAGGEQQPLAEATGREQRRSFGKKLTRHFHKFTHKGSNK